MKGNEGDKRATFAEPAIEPANNPSLLIGYDGFWLWKHAKMMLMIVFWSPDTCSLPSFPALFFQSEILSSPNDDLKLGTRDFRVCLIMRRDADERNWKKRSSQGTTTQREADWIGGQTAPRASRSTPLLAGAQGIAFQSWPSWGLKRAAPLRPIKRQMTFYDLIDDSLRIVCLR